MFLEFLKRDLLYFNFLILQSNKQMFLSQENG